MTSTITGNGIIGGLVGKNNVEINYSQAVTNLIEVTGNDVGGLVGFNYSDGHYQSGRIEHSYAINSNKIVGESNVGGLVGKNGNQRDLQEELSGVNPECASGSENVNGYRFAGGEIQFSYVDGETIYGKNGGANIGGFIGYGWESRVQASYADVDNSVYGTGYGTGDVMPVENIGGFIGYAWDSSVRSSFARGDVYGSFRNVGGFVGKSQTSTFMYNFAVNEYIDGYSPEGICHDPTEDADASNSDHIKATKQYPTEDLCNAVGTCQESEYTDETSCMESGYCFDPSNSSNSDVTNYTKPESCIYAGACYAFSTSYADALSDVNTDEQIESLSVYYLNIVDEVSSNDDGDEYDSNKEVVDYREKCLASYSCIDANGELVDAETFEECIGGGMCITTLVSEGFNYNDEGDDGVQQTVVNVDGSCATDSINNATNVAPPDGVCDVDDSADRPARYDRTPDGILVSNKPLSDGRMPDYFLRAGSDGNVIRDRGNCCQYGGLEDDNHPHEVRWVANKWVKNYWVPKGYNWTFWKKNRRKDVLGVGK